MEHWYNPTTDDTLFGMKACKHHITKELCLFGKYGEVWDMGSNKAGVLLYPKYPQKRALLMRKYAPTMSFIDPSSEIVFRVPDPTSLDILKDLKIHQHAGRQLTQRDKNYKSRT